MAYTQKQGRDPLPKTGNGITNLLLRGAGAAGAKASISNDSIPSAKYTRPVPASKKTKVASSPGPTNSMHLPSMVKAYPSKKAGKIKRVHTGIKSTSKKLGVKGVKLAKAKGIKNISEKL